MTFRMGCLVTNGKEGHDAYDVLDKPDSSMDF